MKTWQKPNIKMLGIEHTLMGPGVEDDGMMSDQSPSDVHSEGRVSLGAKILDVLSGLFSKEK